MFNTLASSVAGTTSTLQHRPNSPHSSSSSSSPSAPMPVRIAAGMLGVATCYNETTSEEDDTGASSSSSTSSSPCSTPPSYDQPAQFGTRLDPSTESSHHTLTSTGSTSRSASSSTLNESSRPGPQPRRPSALCKAPSTSSLKRSKPSSSSLASKKKTVSFAESDEVRKISQDLRAEDGESSEEDEVEYVVANKGDKPVRSSFNWKKWNPAAGSAVFELNMSNDDLMRRG